MSDIIAKWIFNEVILMVGTIPCRVIEIELYQTPDPFNHNDEHQLTSNCWYFHRQNSKSYKNGTYKGVDVTCGSINNKFYGGILIRSIYNLYNSIVIEGPCKVVDFILNTNGCSSINDLVNKSSVQPPLINDTSFPLHFISESPNKYFDIKSIYSGPRVGLSLNKSTSYDDIYCKYIYKSLRYTCFPELLSKNKFHMVLAYVNEHLNNYEFWNEHMIFSIRETFKVTENKIREWIKYYFIGKNKKLLDGQNSVLSNCYKKFNLKTVSDSCEAYGYFMN